jgi:hypothetical protein
VVFVSEAQCYTFPTEGALAATLLFCTCYTIPGGVWSDLNATAVASAGLPAEKRTPPMLPGTCSMPHPCSAVLCLCALLKHDVVFHVMLTLQHLCVSCSDPRRLVTST